MHKRLENFIREHKEAFDDYEPSEALWAKLDEAIAQNQKQAPRSIFLFTRYAVAAAVAGLIIATTLFFLNKHTAPADAGLVTAAPVQKQITDPVIAGAPVEKEQPAIVAVAKKVQRSRQYKRKGAPAAYKKSNTDDQENTGYQPGYVIINGKPVKSEDEAMQITEKSLNMLAMNINKGVDNMKTLKHLSINL
ncbi:MAG: hypothetical protein QM640_00390 [Niabella sp.]